MKKNILLIPLIGFFLHKSLSFAWSLNSIVSSTKPSSSTERRSAKVWPYNAHGWIFSLNIHFVDLESNVTIALVKRTAVFKKRDRFQPFLSCSGSHWDCLEIMNERVGTEARASRTNN